MNPVADGTLSFRGGQHDGILPDRIGEDQYRRGVNITTQGGGIGPRPGFIQRKAKVITSGRPIEGGLTYSQVFKRGKIQSVAKFNANLILVISGIIYSVDMTELTAEVISMEVEGDRMNQFRRRIHWSEAGDFLVFFDYPSQTVIFDGRTARRADEDRESLPGVPLPEVPVAVLGAYNSSRLFVANDGHEFLAGDPVGGINPDAPITFEESLAPAGAFSGQTASLGSGSANDVITAMGFLLVQDSSTGIGPLVVMTNEAIHAFRADLPRADWANSAFGRVILPSAGAPGPRAIVNVNSDLHFVSGENQIRSLSLSATQQQNSWRDTPISREVDPFLLEYARKDLLPIAFAVTHKNRIFFSVAPFQVSAQTLEGHKVRAFTHGGIIVLELDNISSIAATANPAWTGLWTGINPVDAIEIEGVLYFVCSDSNGNTIFQMDETKSYDVFEGEEKNITCRLYTREYDFGQRFFDKENLSIDYNFCKVSGKFQILAEYKANHFARWTKWADFEHCAETQTCDPGCGPLVQLAEHAFRDLNFGDPEEVECDPVTQDLSSVFRKLQLRLTIRARNWRLEEIRLRAEMIPEDKTAPFCAKSKTVVIPVPHDLSDWNLYKVAA
jgi:hypothetical protein